MLQLNHHSWAANAGGEVVNLTPLLIESDISLLLPPNSPVAHGDN